MHKVIVPIGQFHKHARRESQHELISQSLIVVAVHCACTLATSNKTKKKKKKHFFFFFFFLLHGLESAENFV
jgi:hypothetical protein